MESSYEFFRRTGAKEVPYNQLPNGYKWITGCGGNDGWYYNFFATDENLLKYDSNDNSHVLMCKIVKNK